MTSVSAALVGSAWHDGQLAVKRVFISVEHDANFDVLNWSAMVKSALLDYAHRFENIKDPAMPEVFVASNGVRIIATWGVSIHHESSLQSQTLEKTKFLQASAGQQASPL